MIFYLFLLMLVGCGEGRLYHANHRRHTNRLHVNRQDCSQIKFQKSIDVVFNPAFLAVDQHENRQSSLFVSSFFNVGGVSRNGTLEFFERDLVAQIPGIQSVLTIKNKHPPIIEKLTDLVPGRKPKLVWPNEISRAPHGVFPFNALVIPQGFLMDQLPGRLTAVNLDTPNHTEYVIHQSTMSAAGRFTFPLDPYNSPRFYHRVLYIDMNGDGLLDLVTVRSGFKLPPHAYPPSGELVWFENPGWKNIKPEVQWQVHIIYGGPIAGFQGPDMNLRAYDFDGDGVAEIVATHLFTGSKIALYGVPHGSTWKDVDGLDPAKQPRVANISTDQGFPFDIEIVDLNHDGRMDILATNSQPDGVTNPAGRVYVLEQPKTRNIFSDPWTTHVVMDQILPQPSLPLDPDRRMAPGKALAFSPFPKVGRPWIVVGGDEAGKVWLLKPTENDWVYQPAVMFDVNAFYGPNTTQTILANRPGVAIHTIGGVEVAYAGRHDQAEIFVPVYEAGTIFVFSMRQSPRCQV